MPEAVRIFIAPPIEEALRTRLVGRGTDDARAGRGAARHGRAKSCARRTSSAHVVFNDRLDDAVERARGGRPDSARIWCLESDGGTLLISPRVDRLLEHVDSPYASVIVAAKRARQINSYYHNLGEGTFEEFPPPMVDTGSKNYLTIALEEVATGKVEYRYRRLRPTPPMPRILLGVCGGIAAYKALEFTRLALKAGHSVRVMQTEASTRFVGPRRFAGITGAPVLRHRVGAGPAARRLPRRSAARARAALAPRAGRARRRVPDRARRRPTRSPSSPTATPTTC